MRSEDRGHCHRGAGWEIASKGLGLLLALLLAAPVGAGLCSCPGDCDRDCVVSSHDFTVLLSSVFDPQVCADADGDGRVGAADVLIVHVALVDPPAGCTSETSPTPSKTPTSSPTVPGTHTATPSRTATLTTRPTSTASPTVEPTPPSRWIPLARLPDGGRQEVGVAYLEGKIYVIGGLSPGATDRVDAYEIAGNRWTEVAPLPQAGHHIGAAALGGHVYAIGGLRGASFTPTTDVFRYDPGDDRWDPVAPLPTARGALAVAVANGRIHAVAGNAGRGLGVRDHAAYIPAEDRWIELAPFPLSREHITAASVGDTVYVIGGRSPLDRNAHRWNDAAGIWEPLPQMKVARAGHAAAGLSGRLVVFGGEGGGSNANPRGVFPQVEVYDPSTNRWTQLEDMAAPRHGIGAVTAGNRIYVPGGADIINFGPVDTHDALEIDF